MPTQLYPNQKVAFVVRKAAPAVFSFEVTEPSKITIESSNLSDSDAKTETFLTVNDENVCKSNFHWKAPPSAKTIRVDISPENIKFKVGTYRVSL